MSEHELVEAYKAGRIGQVKFFRGLVKGGMSVSAALAAALALAPTTGADVVCLPGVCEIQHSPQLAIATAITNIQTNVTTNVLANNPSVVGNSNVVTNTAEATAHLVQVAESLRTPGGGTP
jgi:hypothetical protein